MATLHFKRERVAVDAIVFDAGTQVRAAINDQVVAEYAERMAEGIEFPPVVLFHDGVRYYLADGFHRTLAAKRNEFRDIEADVEVGTRTDALWFALAANKTNGQRLTVVDKKHAITLALAAFPDRSGSQISEQIGCSQRYVSTIKDQVRTTSILPDRVTGKDGRSYPAKVNRSPEAAEARRDLMRELAAQGHSVPQIADKVGLRESSCRDIINSLKIDVPASRAMGKLRRHDANRIVNQMVSDAENLCADVNLIDFSQLDQSQVSAWVTSLQASRRTLGAFIRRLEQEQKKHGEAA